MATKTDYYDILGVSKSASAEEIKKAYRKQALEWHPDKHKDDKEAAEKRFKEVNEAYQVLSDSKKRSAYDQYGSAAFSPGGMPGGSPFSQSGRYGPFTYTYTTQGGNGGNPFAGYDFGDPFEIFEQFFGGGNPFRAQRQQVPRYSLTIDFMEAVKGCQKSVEVGGKKRKIRIPAGIDEGTQINFKDFILSVNIRSHNIFERDREDVYVKVIIPFSLAVLGGMIKVPTVEGDIKIRIRPGTQSGTIIRLRDKGIKRLHGRGHGDEYVRINVLVPEKVSREQRKIIEDLKNNNL